MFLCSAAEAKAYKTELSHVKVALAALSPQRITQQDMYLEVPVMNSKGRCESRWRYLVQLGATQVSYDVQMEKVLPRNQTAVVVMRCVEKWCGANRWAAANSNPKGAAVGWLKHRAEVNALDCWHPVQMDTKGGLRVLQIMARIPKNQVDAACLPSGTDGVFCRELFTQETDQSKHKIVWLPKECLLEAALRQAKRVSGSLGLVVNDRGLGVRVIAEKHKEAVNVLMGEEAANIVDQDVFEVKDCPVWWSEDVVEEALTSWGWQAKVVRRGLVSRGRRTWFVKAKDAPAAAFMQTEEGLVKVQKAQKPPAKEPTATRVWNGGAVGGQTEWASVWSDLGNRPATVVSPVGNSSLARPAQPSSAPAPRVTRMPGTPIFVAPGTPVGTQSEVASASVIATAIEQAMAPHMAAMLDIQKCIVAMSERVGLLELAAGEQTIADAKRRRKAEEQGLLG